VPLVLPVIKANEAPPPPPKKKHKKKKNAAAAQSKEEGEEDETKSTTVDETNKSEEKKNYYPSIVDSLYSVTIHPNPIRGYDWRGLIKRDEVIEETFVKVVDGDGNEISVDEILSSENDGRRRREEEMRLKMLNWSRQCLEERVIMLLQHLML
jgi:hypothetical protein